jgi:osmotically-inducible protein OsmY
MFCTATFARGDEPNVGEKIGRQIDRAAIRIADELKQGWADVQRSVEKMGLRGRVYARLHWDRDLNSSNLEVEALDNDTVALKGNVPSTLAREKAVRLARETIGVRDVVNHLKVAPPATAQ